MVKVARKLCAAKLTQRLARANAVSFDTREVSVVQRVEPALATGLQETEKLRSPISGASREAGPRESLGGELCARLRGLQAECELPLLNRFLTLTLEGLFFLREGARGH